jgi:hypothetical protein
MTGVGTIAKNSPYLTPELLLLNILGRTSPRFLICLPTDFPYVLISPAASQVEILKLIGFKQPLDITTKYFVDRESFVRLFKAQEAVSNRIAVDVAFQFFDKRNRGFVDFQEFVNVLEYPLYWKYGFS